MRLLLDTCFFPYSVYTINIFILACTYSQHKLTFHIHKSPHILISFMDAITNPLLMSNPFTTFGNAFPSWPLLIVNYLHIYINHDVN